MIHITPFAIIVFLFVLSTPYVLAVLIFFSIFKMKKSTAHRSMLYYFILPQITIGTLMLIFEPRFPIIPALYSDDLFYVGCLAILFCYIQYLVTMRITQSIMLSTFLAHTSSIVIIGFIVTHL